jgi:carboxyl-terminal processing protease
MQIYRTAMGCLILGLILASPKAGAQAGAPAEATEPDLALFDQVWSLVDRHFVDRRFGGKDWRQIGEQYRERYRQAPDPRQQRALINAMLGELGASHCVLLAPGVYETYFAPELRGGLTPRAGFELVLHQQRYLVHRLYEGSPATRAGLRLGDEVLAIGEHATAESPDLVDPGNDPGIPGEPHYVVRAQLDAPLRLTIRSRAEQPAREVSFQPVASSQVEASRASVRVIDHEGWKLGYLHLWHFMSPEIARILEHALTGPLAACDGLLLDIRGRGGRPDVMQRIFANFEGKQRRWDRPVVCLIDEASRSAKDVFAYNWRQRAVGPLVGRRTAGAVLGSTLMPLRDGSYLLLAVVNVDGLAGGVRLEGHGVEPDIAVPRELQYLEGRDPILEMGREVLLQRIRRTY